MTGKDCRAALAMTEKMAGVLKATNRLDEAEPLMRRAVEIFEDSLGAEHPSTVTVRGNLERFLEGYKKKG